MRRQGSDLMKQRSSGDLTLRMSRQSSGSLNFKEGYLEDANNFYIESQKLLEQKDRKGAYEKIFKAMEYVFEGSRGEIDGDILIKAHFRLADFIETYLKWRLQEETGEFDLNEILNTPRSVNDNLVLTKDTLGSALFYLKIQLKMIESKRFEQQISYRIKKYPKSFTGSQLVKWLVEQKIVLTRTEGVLVGQQLVDLCLIYHVESDQHFQDAPVPFRLVKPHLYHLQFQMRDSVSGLLSMKEQSAKKKTKSFPGKEATDWLSKHPTLILKEGFALQICQELFLCNLIKPSKESKSVTEFSDKDDSFYVFTREDESVRGLISPTAKGWINIHWGNQKWKSRYFVLMGQQKKLYYFENEESSKPKGIISLSNAVIRNVDDSLFNKPNCFQVVTPDGAFFFCFEEPLTKEEWMSILNQVSKEKDSEEQGTRQMSSFRIKIHEAQELSSNADKGFYAILSFPETQIARTQTQWWCKNGVASWDEDFFIEELPPTVEKVIVTVFSKKITSSQTHEVGHATIELASLSSHIEVDQWFNLTSESKASGKIHLIFTLEEELMLPDYSYKSILELSTSEFEIPYFLLNSSTATDKEQLYQNVLKVFESRGKTLDFIKYLVERDLNGIHESNVLFRVNTIATRAVVEYLKMVGRTYFSDLLQPILNEIAFVSSTLEEASYGPEIESLLVLLFDKIFRSLNKVPVEFKTLFTQIRKECTSKFPNDPNVGFLSVTSFLFLRVICPAIISPQVFGILEGEVNENTSKTLKSIAKYLQSIANNKYETESDSDPKLKEILHANVEEMKKFVDGISLTTFPTESSGLTNIDLQRELATFYYNIVCRSNDVIDNIKPDLRGSLSDMLDEISAAYEEKWPNRSTPYQYKISLSKAVMFL